MLTLNKRYFQKKISFRQFLTLILRKKMLSCKNALYLIFCEVPNYSLVCQISCVINYDITIYQVSKITKQVYLNMKNVNYLSGYYFIYKLVRYHTNVKISIN